MNPYIMRVIRAERHVKEELAREAGRARDTAPQPVRSSINDATPAEWDQLAKTNNLP